MGKSLIIVESPAKTRTLRSFVGPEFEIAASMGHVRDLPPKSLGVDVDNGFAPRYEPIAERRETLAQLRKRLKSAAAVYLASDPDREGEAIAWHLTQALGITNPRRIEFNEITRRAVQEALQHPREIDMRRVNAQQARRVLDRLVGYKLSPLLQDKLRRRNLSAGRVQSVAVKMVCDREREIKAFTPQEYWDIFAFLTPGDESQAFRAKLVKIGEAKAQVGDGEQAARIVEEARKQAYQVAQIKRSLEKRSPAAPFITSTLQQEASSRLGLSARRTMSLAQELYEGLELGPEGAVGLITYMRTDSTRVAAEAQAEARDFIAAEFGADYLPGQPRQFRARKGAQEAHEAIRPTSVARRPEAVAPYLNRDQLRLYRLIWARFVASQMADAVLDVMMVDAVGGPYLFRVTGQAVKFPGFMRVYSAARAAHSGAEEINLPRLEQGQALRLLDLKSEQKFTEPPPYYTEASLVRALEAKGIGRPSTYAPILATIRERGYVYLDRVNGRRVLRPTDLGFVVTDQLSQHFPRIMDVQFTAQVEEQLDRVEQGDDDWVELLRSFYGPFEESLRQAEKRMGPVRISGRPTQEKCPRCGKPLVIRTGRNGPFYGCTGYPECDHTAPLEGEKQSRAAEPTGEVCEQCGGAMVRRSGRRGAFLGCSGYPKCKNTRPLPEEAQQLGAPQKACPRCGRPLAARHGRRGWFLGCSGYPECKHAEPMQGAAPAALTGENCARCGAPMVVRRGKRGYFAGCSAYPKCRNAQPLRRGDQGQTEPEHTAATAESA